MNMQSVPTRGRTLDHAANVYDIVEPMFLLGRQDVITGRLIEFLKLDASHRILDIGCGTGFVTKSIADRLTAETGGCATGIDAAAKMIEGAIKKRGSDTCRFETAAAENLPFEDESFDSVVSTLFFHHVPLDLKKKAMSEAFRVLKPGGRLVISDMHTPTTFIGALISHASRWLLFQPEIGENIRGVLPGLIEDAGFEVPRLIDTFFGYIALFSSRKPQG